MSVVSAGPNTVLTNGCQFHRNHSITLTPMKLPMA
jgi:hypothetical protein